MELTVAQVFDADDPKKAASEYVSAFSAELIRLIVGLHNEQIKNTLDFLEHYHLHVVEALKGKGVFLPDSLYAELTQCLTDEAVHRAAVVQKLPDVEV